MAICISICIHLPLKLPVLELTESSSYLGLGVSTVLVIVGERETEAQVGQGPVCGTVEGRGRAGVQLRKSTSRSSPRNQKVNERQS